MKVNTYFILLMTITSCHLMSQNQYPIREDVETISGLIDASYEVISGDKGEKRQWERDASLHHPKAVYSYRGEDGGQTTISVAEFHSSTDGVTMTEALYETEINREVKIFGNIAHVWSTYTIQNEKNGPIVRRGINSIQLVQEDDRWWIISWTFDDETPSNRIPQTFDRY